ncbi:hypothetical protein [Streptomyces sp. 1222.5]|uniref:hypothetical protein n=1 Tax=Streptomyces sp. 1222.5 TaxID=1881026 RepID=UPI003EB9CDCA
MVSWYSHRPATGPAERPEDPVIMASAARHLTDAMTAQGQAQAAASAVPGLLD